MSDSEEEVEYEPEEFVLGPFNLTVTTISFMPIEVLAANQGKGVEISGQKLWCGSICVIQYLLDNPAIVHGHPVIELGAGTGVLGMVCSRLGATRVNVNDHDMRSINHMTSDIETNHLASTMSVSRLDWFKENAAKEVFGDWAAEYNSDAAGMMLVAGDVLYKNALLKPFFNTVASLFCMFPGSKLMLCHVPRAGVEHSDVLAEVSSRGYVVQTIPPDSFKSGPCYEYCPTDDLDRAALYVISESA